MEHRGVEYRIMQGTGVNLFRYPYARARRLTGIGPAELRRARCRPPSLGKQIN